MSKSRAQIGFPASSRDMDSYHLGLTLLQVSTASVVYFELQAHEKGAARMLLYENSKCQVGIGGVGWLEGFRSRGICKIAVLYVGMLTFSYWQIS